MRDLPVPFQWWGMTQAITSDHKKGIRKKTPKKTMKNTEINHSSLGASSFRRVVRFSGRTRSDSVRDPVQVESIAVGRADAERLQKDVETRRC